MGGGEGEEAWKEGGGTEGGGREERVGVVKRGRGGGRVGGGVLEGMVLEEGGEERRGVDAGCVRAVLFAVQFPCFADCCLFLPIGHGLELQKRSSQTGRGSEAPRTA